MTVPLSILDLAQVSAGMTIRESLAASVGMARAAEAGGYRRVWYAEHHNMKTIASSATSVVIGHIADHTSSIRLGSGGIMLPNHAPLTIAEQFGTLETLHPGRIDLGLGRAPGTDGTTMRALRRDASAADTFPDDVLELQGYLSGDSRVPGVQAIPGTGTNVPLYMLGSSLFGAQLAAKLGLPYAFASHFAPDALEDAVALYRRDFTPSEQLDQPYVMAAASVTAADTAETAEEQALQATRRMVGQLLAGGRDLTDEEADAVLASPAGQRVSRMRRYSVAGEPATVREYLDRFAKHARADEVITVHQAGDPEARIRSIELLAPDRAAAQA